MTPAVTDPPQLTPQVLDRLKQLQEADRPVSVDEILEAANLDRLVARQQQPHASKSAELRPSPQPRVIEKSISSNTSTLAERRKVPSSPEKLKIYAQITSQQPEMLHDANCNQQLQQQNALMSPQPDEEYLFSRIEKQSALLSTDPKGMCIESSRLQTEVGAIDESAIDDRQFWEYVVHDFATAVRELPHLLAAKLRRGGVPGALRGVVWRAMCMASATHLESIYDKLVREEIETSPYERVISRDLTRTFPQVELFQKDGGEGQQAMGRLLRAYSVYDAHVGYCQGLAFLAGPLLMTMSERDAFCTFVRLMETYDMRTMFTLNMEGLHLRLHQFSTLLAQVCPRLEAHLTSHSIHPPMYASQWFLTLFAYTFPIELVLRIYDIVFAQGAVETITRVAIAVMQRNEDQLLAINDFEKLMLYLSSRKMYEHAFNSDPEQVIAAAMDLSAVITKQKMDSIAESHHKELALEKDRAQQVLAIRFAKSNKSKRESWFSRRSTPSTPTSPTTSNSSSSTTSTTTAAAATSPRNVQLLHQQIEDLVLALSQLQKDHSRLSEEMLTVKMREMDHEAEKQRLLARNHMLEKRIRKYKGRLSMSQPPLPPPSVDSEQQRLKELERDQEFCSFVNSLRMSGDFGALIASALSSEGKKATTTAAAAKHINHQEDDEEENDDDDGVVAIDGNNDDHLAQQELEKLQAAHAELNTKYQELETQYHSVAEDLANSNKIREDLVAKVKEMEQDMQDLHDEKEQLLDEREDMEQERRELEDKLLAAKKTASELQLEKMTLAKDVERLEKRVQELEKEKQEYLMPRGSFSEEVFAAHQTLFGEKKRQQQQQQQQDAGGRQNGQHADEYQQKYIESELRCRELEKLLAETKCRLVEYEAASPVSPRVSLQQPPLRRRSTTTKRSSTASLSMLANGRMSTPTSPGLYYDRMSFAPEPRESTDSLASSTSGVSKRSSMYSRIWSSFSTAATSPTSSVAHKSPVLSSTKAAEELLVEEPHEI